MKKGFTLVELLAVIVILAVILVIAVPQINNVIKQTRINGLKSTAKLIVTKAEEKEVENDALGINDTIQCSDLVNLDDNYGNCTVTKSGNNWTVTITGSGKFDGFSCTGTKNNMNCTESNITYVYAFGDADSLPLVFYTYTYTITDVDACISYFNNLFGVVNELNITSLCNGNEVEGITTGRFIDTMIIQKNADYDDVSSFATRSNPTLKEILSYENATDDYTTLKYPETDDQVQEFTKWGANGETVFLDSICTLYGGSLTCLETKSSAYSENVEKIETLFGSSNCATTSDYTKCDVVDYYCKVMLNGNVQCGNDDFDYYVCGSGINVFGEVSAVCKLYNHNT